MLPGGLSHSIVAASFSTFRTTTTLKGEAFTLLDPNDWNDEDVTDCHFSKNGGKSVPSCDFSSACEISCVMENVFFLMPSFFSKGCLLTANTITVIGIGAQSWFGMLTQVDMNVVCFLIVAPESSPSLFVLTLGVCLNSLYL